MQTFHNRLSLKGWLMPSSQYNGVQKQLGQSTLYETSISFPISKKGENGYYEKELITITIWNKDKEDIKRAISEKNDYIFVGKLDLQSWIDKTTNKKVVKPLLNIQYVTDLSGNIILECRSKDQIEKEGGVASVNNFNNDDDLPF